MTFSIVAFDPPTRSWAVAVASCCVGVGAAVPAGGAGLGALATQATVNLGYRSRGLALLQQGVSAGQVTQRLTGEDPQAAVRQLAVMDVSGRVAHHTGDECLPWAGHAVAENVGVQGNLLTGPEVLDAMLAAYEPSQPHVGRRLVGCLAAAAEVGGDRRGLSSSALRVWRDGGAYGGGLDIATDLHVDDHAEPVTELARLVELHHLYYDRPDPSTLLALHGQLATEVAAALTAVGYDPAGRDSLDAAFAEWSGVNNFEERTVPGHLDPVIWEILQQQAREVRA